jgi:hypothetical protein
MTSSLCAFSPLENSVLAPGFLLRRDASRFDWIGAIRLKRQDSCCIIQHKHGELNNSTRTSCSFWNAELRLIVMESRGWVCPDAPLASIGILNHGLEFTYGTGSRTTMRTTWATTTTCTPAGSTDSLRWKMNITNNAIACSQAPNEPELSLST